MARSDTASKGYKKVARIVRDGETRTFAVESEGYKAYAECGGMKSKNTYTVYRDAHGSLWLTFCGGWCKVLSTRKVEGLTAPIATVERLERKITLGGRRIAVEHVSFERVYYHGKLTEERRIWREIGGEQLFAQPHGEQWEPMFRDRWGGLHVEQCWEPEERN